MTKDSASTLLIFFTVIVLPNPVHFRRSEFNDIHGASEVSFGIPKLGRANLKFEIESVGIGYMQRLDGTIHLVVQGVGVRRLVLAKLCGQNPSLLHSGFDSLPVVENEDTGFVDNLLRYPMRFLGSCPQLSFVYRPPFSAQITKKKPVTNLSPCR
jgi:hypothetical protein